jgi:hypothetical protein
MAKRQSFYGARDHSIAASAESEQERWIEKGFEQLECDEDEKDCSMRKLNLLMCALLALFILHCFAWSWGCF